VRTPAPSRSRSLGASGWKPRLWFLILPCVFYLVAFGAFAALFAYLASQQAA